jgi:hypothetical protein
MSYKSGAKEPQGGEAREDPRVAGQGSDERVPRLGPRAGFLPEVANRYSSTGLGTGPLNFGLQFSTPEVLWTAQNGNFSLTFRRTSRR